MLEVYPVSPRPFGVDGLLGDKAVAPTLRALVDPVHLALVDPVLLIVMVRDDAVIGLTVTGSKDHKLKFKVTKRHQSLEQTIKLNLTCSSYYQSFRTHGCCHTCLWPESL